jgi:hypothetical protein
MGLFTTIKNKIFRQTAYAERPHDAAPPQANAGGSPPRPGEFQTGPGAATGPVDVEAILNRMASENKQKLDWRHSIVDLMKLLGMDSSLANRKELAAELNYTGDTNDSAAMNMWLHKQVMRKLAENGGRVPADLLD